MEQSGSFKAVQDDNGIHFERMKPRSDDDASPFQHVHVTEKMKSRTQQEMEAGAKRVAHAAELNANRPPRVISEKERLATPTNTPVFRPNSVYADRTKSFNGAPVSQALGNLMRKTGGGKAPPAGG